MKKIIINLLNKFGYDIKKINKDFKNPKLDEILKKKISEKPLILDVGGNKGQSIINFQKIFKEPIIHSFDPNKLEFNVMYKKFKNHKNVFLNNYAIGEVEGEKSFNIAAQTGASSFNQLNMNSKWIQVRSKEFNKTLDQFVQTTKVKLKSLDNYCLENRIERIDFLKIDTQGYEDKVLQGSTHILKKNKIKAILTEIMFDNTYQKYFSFSDIENYLLKNNFRMVAIYLSSNSLFGNLTFFADVLYLNKNYYKF